MNRLLHVLALALLVRPGRLSSATNKLSLASWGSYDYRGHKGPGTYAFGYDIEDPVTGNVHFRHEEKHLNGTVTGSYGYVDAGGVPRVTNYVSDVHGYRIISSTHAMSVSAGERGPYNPEDDDHAFPAVPFDHPKTDRIYNSPPLMYELASNAPFFGYNPRYLVPLPLLGRRK